MKNKFSYIAMNFFIPGMGQIAAKRYLRGILQVIGSLGSILWMAALVIMPFVKFYGGDISNENIPRVDMFVIIPPVLLFLVIFAWSIIDFFLGFESKFEIKSKEKSV